MRARGADPVSQHPKKFKVRPLAELDKNLHSNLPEPSGTSRSLHSVLHQKPAEPSSGTLHQHLPQPSRTFRNLLEPCRTCTWHCIPPEPSETEPSATFTWPCNGSLQNLHRNLPELSGTLRNLHMALHRNCAEPSGTCACHPHRHTPELIWAEDPHWLTLLGKNLQYHLAEKLETILET